MSNVKQKCGPLPPGCAVNLNKLNLIEIELFIEMLYGVLSSVQPDYETNKSPRRMQVSAPVTGAAGSMIVPQYGFSKITAVFVCGKNMILKFVGNTKYKSMKLTLQLVFVVLIAPTKFELQHKINMSGS